MSRIWLVGLGTFLIIVTVVAAQQSQPVSENQDVVNTMTDFFKAIQDGNDVKYRSLTEPEFFVFDGGRRLSRDAMLDTMKALEAAGNRYDWHVTDPQVHVSGNIAWIAYTNQGSVTNAGVTKPRKWLESAILQRDGGRWKITFAQSTPVP